jgi:hypothetical protein
MTDHEMPEKLMMELLASTATEEEVQAAKYYHDLAISQRILFDELKRVGFNENQAFAIMLTDLGRAEINIDCWDGFPSSEGEEKDGRFVGDE